MVSHDMYICHCLQNVSSFAPCDIAKQLKDQQLVMAGHSEGLMYGELKHITSTAASLDGAVLGMPTLRHRGPDGHD